MNRILGTALIAGVLAQPGELPAQTQPQEPTLSVATEGGSDIGAQARRDRWIVMFRHRGFDLGTYRAAMHERLAASDIAAIVADLDERTVADQQPFVADAQRLGAEVLSQWWLINGCALRATADVAATLRRDPRVAYVIPDRLNRAMASRRAVRAFQESAVDQWNHNAARAHQGGYTGLGAAGTAPAIAVVDSQLEWFDPAAPAPWNAPSHASLFDDASGVTRIVESVRAANITLPATLLQYQTNFQTSIYNSAGSATGSWPGQHGSGIGHAAAARRPLASAPPPAPGAGQAPNARIVSVDIIEDYSQITSGSVFACTAPADARYSSTIAITNACQWLATYAAQYQILVAVCAYGGCGNPWSPEQQAMDSLVLNADVVMCVPSGNYFEDGSSGLNRYPFDWSTDDYNFSVGRNATAWDSMYGANSIVSGATFHDSKVVTTWSGVGPLDRTRSRQASSPFGVYGSTYCTGWEPDNYFAVPATGHDFSRQYPDLVAVGAAVTIVERSWNQGQAQAEEDTATVDGASISCAEVAGAALLYRAGLDGAMPGAVPSALATKAVLLASAEDISAANPATTGPTGQNLYGAGFLRTDHAVLGAASIASGSAVPGLTTLWNFAVDADSVYGIALVWNRSEFSMTPPVSTWPIGQPTPTGNPWADFDMTVVDTFGNVQNVASTYGNRTWEHARIATTAAGTISVTVTRNAQGPAAAEDFVVALVKVASAATTPAIYEVAVAGGANPCRSYSPTASGTTLLSSGFRNQGPGWPAGGYGSFNGVGGYAPVRGPDRMVRVGIENGFVAGDYAVVSLTCQSDRDMLLRARLGSQSQQLDGTLVVRAGSATAVALFPLAGGIPASTISGTGWGSQILTQWNPVTGTFTTIDNGWIQIPKPNMFLFEFEAPPGLRFLRRYRLPPPTAYSTAAFPPANFRYEWLRVRVGTEVGGVVGSWGDAQSQPLDGHVATATMRAATATLGTATPDLLFSESSVAIGRTYHTEARGFELGGPHLGVYVIAFALAGTPAVFSGTTGGLACDCVVGVDLGNAVQSAPLLTDAIGGVRGPDIAIPYDPVLLGGELLHQTAVLEPNLVHTTKVMGSRVVLR